MYSSSGGQPNRCHVRHTSRGPRFVTCAEIGCSPTRLRAGADRGAVRSRPVCFSTHLVWMMTTGCRCGRRSGDEPRELRDALSSNLFEGNLILSKLGASIETMTGASDYADTLRSVALRVTRPRMAVSAGSRAASACRYRLDHAGRTPAASGHVPPNGLRLVERAHRGRSGAPHPAVRLGRPLRITGRRQPPPHGLPLLRPHRRRRLRGRRGALPAASDDLAASRSMRPRSSTGACAPTAPPSRHLRSHP